YPVSYDDPAVLGVGAGAAFSNHGRGVDVLAPGQHVLSLGFPAGYAYRSGTSMSAAVVSRTLAAEAVADPLAPVPALGDALVATSIDGVVDASAAVAAVRRGR